MKTIFDCNTIEELKEFGKLKEIREEFLKRTPANTPFKLNTYKAILEAIIYIREATKMAYCEMNGQPAPEYNSLFFKGKAEEYIYYLTQVDEETRCDKLRINRLHYHYPEKAKQWYREIVKVVHPDNCAHPLAAEAYNEATRFYKSMTKR